MDAKDLTIDDLAYLLVSKGGPDNARMHGETFTIEQVAQVFEDKREELDVSQRGDYATGKDGQFQLSFDEGRKS